MKWKKETVKGDSNENKKDIEDATQTAKNTEKNVIKNAKN